MSKQKVVLEALDLPGDTRLMRGDPDRERFEEWPEKIRSQNGGSINPLAGRALPTLQSEGWNIVQIVPADAGAHGHVRYLLERQD